MEEQIDAEVVPSPHSSVDTPVKRINAVRRRVLVIITWKSIFRILLGILLAYVTVILWPLFQLLILAVFIAVALYPIVGWVLGKGWPRWVGLVLASATLLVVVVGCFAVIGPVVFREASTLGENLPQLREQILSHLPASGLLREAMENGISSGAVANSRLLLERALALLQTTVGGLFHFVVVIVFAIYLMVDGPRSVKWCSAFFPIGNRQRISQTLGQLAELISAYVAGQFLVSVLCAAYVFLLLTLLHVPMALLLGIIAGILDILPIIGFLLAVCLAMAMGLTVSPTTALLVLVLYGAYHLFENFYVLPKVYGKKLRLSKLAVPLAVAAGGMLAGVVGAIAALPMVAAYTVGERLWLAPALEPDTIKEHEQGSNG